jgi:copper chaperone CopZ
MKAHELTIEGMTCGHCVRAVEQALSEIPGVQRVEVEIGHARVEAEEQVTRDALVAAVEEESYRVAPPP